MFSVPKTTLVSWMPARTCRDGARAESVGEEERAEEQDLAAEKHPDAEGRGLFLIGKLAARVPGLQAFGSLMAAAARLAPGAACAVRPRALRLPDGSRRAGRGPGACDEILRRRRRRRLPFEAAGAPRIVTGARAAQDATRRDKRAAEDRRRPARSRPWSTSRDTPEIPADRRGSAAACRHSP